MFVILLLLGLLDSAEAHPGVGLSPSSAGAGSAMV